MTARAVGFTGKERDAETGLDYFDSRYLSASQGRFLSADTMIAKEEWLADPQRWNRYSYVRNNPLRYVDPNGEDLVVYTFFGSDLSEDQKKYLQANMGQIQAGIAAKFKEAGVNKVEFRDGSKLTAKQVSQILSNGESGSATGVGLLNFASEKFGSFKAGSADNGATFADSRSVVFMKNLSTGLNLANKADAAAMNFRLVEVSAHELGHGQSFDADMAIFNFIKDLGGTRFGFGNLMGEGQGIPDRPKKFDATQGGTSKAIREINRIGDGTPKR